MNAPRRESGTAPTSDPTLSHCAPHIAVSQYISPPSQLGYTHSSVVNMLRSSILTTRALLPFVILRRFKACHASYSRLLRTRCRCIASSRRLIRPYVPWISPFANANIDESNRALITLLNWQVRACFPPLHCVRSTKEPITASMLETAHMGGRGPVSSDRRWYSGLHAPARHRPWSSPTSCCRRAQSFPRPPSRT